MKNRKRGRDEKPPTKEEALESPQRRLNIRVGRGRKKTDKIRLFDETGGEEKGES